MFKSALIRGLHHFSSYIPLPFLQFCSRQYFLPVFYHTVSDRSLPHIRHLYQVRDTTTFEADLDYLLTHYTPVSLSAVIAHIHGQQPLPKQAFLLTFDDGLAECATVIAPILQRKGIPATFFINSDFVDNKGLMFRYKASLLLDLLVDNTPAQQQLVQQHLSNYQLPFEGIQKSLLAVRWPQQAVLEDLAQALGYSFEQFLEQEQPYMTTAQIQQLLVQGFDIGGHSQNHPTYNLLPLAEQLDQTLQSQLILEEQFDLPHRVFAFPFTDFGVSAAFFERILGQAKFQLTFGGAGLKKETIKGQLQRFGIETQQLDPLRTTLHTEYCYFLLKAIFGKNTLQRI
ncbi:MAG: polysaccharide deacetylase family protein [Aureispira sp.]